MKNKIYLILLMMLTVVTVYGADTKVLLQQAAADYKNGNTESAIAAYDSVIKADGASAGVLYNMGTVYTQAKQYGPARVCYERALKLDPGSQMITNNLDYVASRVDIQNRNDLKGQPLSVLPDDPWFFRSVYNMFAINVTSNTWAIFAAISFILFVVLLGDYIFTKQVWVRKVGFFGAIIMLGLSVVFVVFAFCARSEARSHNTAVIMATKVQLLNEPTDKGKAKTTPLNAGTKVEITETKDVISESGGDIHKLPEWYNVRLNSDISGWIKASDIEII